MQHGFSTSEIKHQWKYKLYLDESWRNATRCIKKTHFCETCPKVTRRKAMMNKYLISRQGIINMSAEITSKLPKCSQLLSDSWISQQKRSLFSAIPFEDILKSRILLPLSCRIFSFWHRSQRVNNSSAESINPASSDLDAAIQCDRRPFSASGISWPSADNILRAFSQPAP